MTDRDVRKKFIAGKIKDIVLEDEALKMHNMKRSTRYIKFGLWIIILSLYVTTLFFNYLTMLDLLILPIILFIIYILIKPKKEDKIIYTIFEYFIGAGLILSDIIITVYTTLFIIYFLIFSHLYSANRNIYSVFSVLIIAPIGVSIYTVFLVRYFSKIMDFLDEKIYSHFVILKRFFIFIILLLSIILLIFLKTNILVPKF
ncbi:MAG: hypothetical protein QXO58_06255 [Thermoplasmata archaeon]